MGSKTASTPKKVEEKEKEVKEEFQKPCAHHWVIEPPSGPISKGTCIKCGAEKEFHNWGQTER